MKPVVFLGSNGNILQMLDIVHSEGRTVAGIVDSDYWGNTDTIKGIPVIGSELEWSWSNEYDYFVAAGWSYPNNEVQHRCFRKRDHYIRLLEEQGIACTNIIHSRAWVPDTVALGQNIMICADVIVQNEVVICDHAQVREQSYLAHNCIIGKNSVISAGAYIGNMVQVGEHAYIGVRATIVPKADPWVDHVVTIAQGAFVKSCAMVTDSITKQTFDLSVYDTKFIG